MKIRQKGLSIRFEFYLGWLEFKSTLHDLELLKTLNTMNKVSCHKVTTITVKMQTISV